MRVTAKGQITIPQKLRDQYGLGPGTEVEVVAGGEGPLIRASRQGGAGTRLVEQLRDSRGALDRRLQGVGLRS